MNFTIHTIIFEQNNLEESTSEDYNYIYQTGYFYATKKAIDINDKEVTIEPKRLINTYTRKIQKNNCCPII